MDTEYLRRTLTNLFRGAMRKAQIFWEETDGNDGRSYDRLHGIFHDVCQQVSRDQDNGYPIFAELVAEQLCCAEVPRNLRSVVLSVLARWLYEITAQCGQPIRGRSVSQFAIVLNATSDVCAQTYVEWFEDMHLGIAVEGGQVGNWVLQPQPTRVMRGILFDARLQNVGMTRFWELAAKAANFPERLFTDPGDNDARSCYLTTMQMKQLSSFIALAPEAAVLRFATVFRDHVRTMRQIVYASLMLRNGYLQQASVCNMGSDDIMKLFEWLGVINLNMIYEKTDVRVKTVPVTEQDQNRILLTVQLGINNVERQQLAKILFFGQGE
ncbi:MAG: hypothetical protein V1738_02735 [Patescibacteria group bacterium]